jgi:hypothetical protein
LRTLEVCIGLLSATEVAEKPTFQAAQMNTTTRPVSP